MKLTFDFKLIVSESHNIFKRFLTKGSFLQDAAISSGAKLGTIILSIAITPIITRIYSPEDYGIFSIFLIIATNISIVATLRLPLAFVLPKTNNEFHALFSLAWFSVMTFSCITLFVVLIPIQSIGGYDLTYIQKYKYLLPIIVLLIGLSEIYSNTILRKGLVRFSSGAGIINLGFSKVFVISYGLIKGSSPFGLIFGEMSIRILGIVSNIIFLRTRSSNRIKFIKNVKKLKNTFIEFKRYPIYLLSSGWLRQISNHISIVLMGIHFGIQEIGFLSFANAILEMPIRLIGENTLGPLLLKRIADTPNDSASKHQLFIQLKKSYLLLAIISLVGFSLIYFFGEFIFELVFGDDWHTSGQYASLLSIVFCARLINTPSSSIIRYKRKDHYFLYISASFVITSFLSILSGYILDSFLAYLITFTALNSTIYFFISILSLKEIKSSNIIIIIAFVLLSMALVYRSMTLGLL